MKCMAWAALCAIWVSNASGQTGWNRPPSGGATGAVVTNIVNGILTDGNYLTPANVTNLVTDVVTNAGYATATIITNVATVVATNEIATSTDIARLASANIFTASNTVNSKLHMTGANEIFFHATGETANGNYIHNPGNDQMTLAVGTVALTLKTNEISVGSRRVEDVSDPTDAQDAVTKNYSDSTYAEVGSANIFAATNTFDAATYMSSSTPIYFGAGQTNYISCPGGGQLTLGVSGGSIGFGVTSVNFGSRVLTSVGDPVSAQDAVTKNYGDTTYARLASYNAFSTSNAFSDEVHMRDSKGIYFHGAGETVNGNSIGNPGGDQLTITVGSSSVIVRTNNWDFSGQEILDLADPTQDQSAVTKNYGDGQYAFKSEIPQNRTYYISDAASDVSGYKVLATTLPSAATTNVISSVTNNQYIASFITAAGEPAVTLLQKGLYEVHYTAKRSNPGSVSVKAELYAFDASGNVLFEIENTDEDALTTSDTDYNQYIPVSTNCVLTATDRVGIRLKITAVSGTVDVTLYYGSPYDSSFSFDVATGSTATTLESLTDVDVATAPATNDVLTYNGSIWTNKAASDVGWNHTATNNINLAGYAVTNGNIILLSTGYIAASEDPTVSIFSDRGVATSISVGHDAAKTGLGANSVVIGADASANCGAGSTLVGQCAGNGNSVGTDNTAVGRWAGMSLGVCANNTYFGSYAGAYNAADNCIGIGMAALYNMSADIGYAISIGNYSKVTQNNQGIIGSAETGVGAQGYITELYCGYGVQATNSIATDFRYRTAHALGANVAGKHMVLSPGSGTGSGAGGHLLIEVAAPGGSGTATNAYATAMTVHDTKLVEFADAIKLDVTTVLPSADSGAGYLFATNVSGTVEVDVMDGGGNISTISPHDFGPIELDANDKYPVSVHHRNDYLGEEHWIYLSQLAKDVEVLTGKKYLYTSSKAPSRNWDADQNAREAKRNAEIAAWDAQAVAYAEYKVAEDAWRVEESAYRKAVGDKQAWDALDSASKAVTPEPSVPAKPVPPTNVAARLSGPRPTPYVKVEPPRWLSDRITAKEP